MCIRDRGVTLEENGIAMFPDAPTERGIKHLDELAQAVRYGYAAAVIFVIQMRGVTRFTPNPVSYTHLTLPTNSRLAYKCWLMIVT